MTVSAGQWFRPFGSAAADGFDVAITPELEGWQHTGLYVVSLAAGQSRQIVTGTSEFIVVPLAGAVSVESVSVESASVESASVESPSVESVGGAAATGRADLTGRASVFAGPTDVAYVPRDSTMTVTSKDGARVALAFAPATKSAARIPFRHLAVQDVPVELRGAGRASREVRNFGTPGVLDADSIIACEVITPAGNWSSYPPHKHDQERDGLETELEEIYYFEAQATAPRSAGRAAAPFGYQRVYTADDRPIDVLAEVRSGDVVLVPHGWHGPSMAPPGYDLYYLNVMAGPGPARAWLICDDPSHAWVRATWAGQDIDPRLPLGGTR